MSRPRAGTFIRALVLVAAFFVVGLSLRPSEKPPAATPPATTGARSPAATGDVRELKRVSEGFRSIGQKVGPAVVSVRSTFRPPGGSAFAGPSRKEGGGAPNQRPEDPFQDFFDFFFKDFGRGMGPMFPRSTPEMALGSGFLIDKEGHILTNNHVVDKASSITVILSNPSKESKAKVIGRDPATDLAILKINSSENPAPVEWADSSSVEVGDWAIAIGSPFGLEHTLTVGVVSAKGRPAAGITEAQYQGGLIQTDAAINPGNSGGPLCTVDGTVMGVNTAIFTESGGYMGIGFAIPSNLARSVAEKLIKHGKIVRGWLGVYIQPLDPALGKQLGVSGGVVIHRVSKGGPALKAGLKAGDVVVAMDGKPAKDVGTLQGMISDHKPGDKIKLDVMSYQTKARRSVTVTLSESPSSQGVTSRERETEEAPDKLGLMVAPAENGKGVQVTAVESGSIADLSGLQEGDIIVSINRKNMDSVSAYRKEIARSKTLDMMVNRHGESLFMRVTLPD